jgi:putative ABC transport system substrate-binding protein
MMGPHVAVRLLVFLALRAAPFAAEAQQAAKAYRVGILSPGGVPDPSIATTPNLVPSVLRELGCVDGRNLVVERRFASGKIDRLLELARELVQLHVDVIFALSDAVAAVRDATTTIPIVMIFGGDPVARGWCGASHGEAGTSPV